MWWSAIAVLLGLLLLLHVGTVAGGSAGGAGSTDCVELQSTLRHLLYNYTYVMDLAVPVDRERHDRILQELPIVIDQLTQPCTAPACHLPPTILHDAVRAVYRAHNHITKDMLASHRRADVAFADLESFAASWVYAPWELLLAAVPSDSLAVPDALGFTVLHLAVLFREQGLVRSILSAPAMARILNAVTGTTTTTFGFTPLHLALINADLDCAAELISQGANVYVRDAFGRTPLDLAVDVLPFVDMRDMLLGALLDSDHQEIATSARSLLAHTPSCRASAGELLQRHGLAARKSAEPLLRGCPFPHVDLQQSPGALTTQDFARDIWSVRLPLIVRYQLDHWQVHKTWQRDELDRRFGDVVVQLGPIPYATIFGEPGGNATLNEYLAYMARYDRSRAKAARPPAYVFDSQIMEDEAFYRMADNRLPTFFDMLGSGALIGKQFILGPAKSGAPLHYHCDAVNALVWGQKHWLLVPPAHAVYSKEHPLGYQERFNAPHLMSTDNHGPLTRPTYVCQQHAGEIVYVPGKWPKAPRVY